MCLTMHIFSLFPSLNKDSINVLIFLACFLSAHNFLDIMFALTLGSLPAAYKSKEIGLPTSAPPRSHSVQSHRQTDRESETTATSSSMTEYFREWVGVFSPQFSLVINIL